MSKERLFELIRTEEVVLWAGSGLSCYAGYPSGNELKEIILNKIPKPEDYQLSLESSLMEVSEQFVKICQIKNPLNRILQDIFKKKPLTTHIHDVISKIPHFKTIITTNYDTLFEDAYKGEVNVLVTDYHLPYRNKSKVDIFKIHGCINILEKIIITKTDYKNFFVDNSDQTQYWTYVKGQAITKPIIFIGYGLNDDNVNVILDKIFNALGEHRRECYLIAPDWPLHKQMDLAQRKIIYIDSTADDFFNELNENIKQNIYLDHDDKRVSTEIFNAYISNYGLSFKLTPLQGKHHTTLVPKDPGVKIQLNFQTDLEISKLIQEQITTKTLSHLTLKGDQIKKFNLSFAGIKVPETIQELLIAPAPAGELTVDIRLLDGNEFEGVKVNIYRLQEDFVATFKVKTLSIELRLNPETINGKDLKTHLTYTHDENCGSIKDEIEVYDFLCHINSGKEFFIFLEDKSHLQLALTKETNQLNEVVFFHKYFTALKRIEREFKVSFKGIKFDEINEENDNISNVALINNVLENTKFNQSWDNGMSIKISSNPEIFFNIINELPATTKIHFTEAQETKLFVHNCEVNIGYLNNLITDPEFVQENEDDEASTSNFKIRSKSGLITLFYSKEYRGAPNTTSSFNIISDQEVISSLYTDK